MRLEACQKRLALISAQPDIPFKQEMLNFVAQQINELQKQQQIRQQIQLAKRKNYSTVATKNFTDALTRYYAKRKKHNGPSSCSSCRI